MAALNYRIVSSRHGRGLDLFQPSTRLLIEGSTATVTAPGRRTEWHRRPSWHGLVYGNGKPGTGNESIVNPDALRSYPVVFDASGKLAKPPADSKHHGADISGATKAKPYRRRRSSADLTREVIDLHQRGLVPFAIANQLNVADRRVKAILAQAVAA